METIEKNNQVIQKLENRFPELTELKNQNTLKEMNKSILHTVLLIMFSIGIHADTSEGLNPTRLIIGFYSDSYYELGGAIEACEYINKHTKNGQPLSLVRPLGNGAILTHINQSDSSQLEKLINQLLSLDKIRYVEIDSTMNPLQNRGMGTTPLR